MVIHGGEPECAAENGCPGTDRSKRGFDGDIMVNDEGDLLMYQVHGRKEKLEERGT